MQQQIENNSCSHIRHCSYNTEKYRLCTCTLWFKCQQHIL